MPKNNINFANTIIYKLINYDCPENIYVGSTTNFVKRKQSHKASSTNPSDKAYTRKVYCVIRENGGWECWHMIEIKKYPCENKQESSKEEDRIMQELKANMNMYRASCSKQEYIEINKEKISENQKFYREKNKEKIHKNKEKYREKNKEKLHKYSTEYREKNKEKIAQTDREYREMNKEKIAQTNKEYREKNKEMIKQQKKDYSELNKEAIKIKKQIKYTCVCGSTYSTDNKCRHDRTAKHIKFCNN